MRTDYIPDVMNRLLSTREIATDYANGVHGYGCSAAGHAVKLMVDGLAEVHDDNDFIAGYNGMQTILESLLLNPKTTPQQRDAYRTMYRALIKTDR